MPVLEPPEGHDERRAVVADLFAGVILAKTAAERLASISLRSKPETGLMLTWAGIIHIAQDFPDHLEELVDLLVNMANLPAPNDDDGNPLLLYGLRIWTDLPMLGWDFNDEWNSLNIAEEGPERQIAIIHFININKFAALLVGSHAAAFASFDLFALWTFRGALETPLEQTTLQSLDAFVPSAAAWISILGSEIYSWDKEFPQGATEGDPGVGGPLWTGKHGFCKERWQLWMSRFEELSTSDQLSDHLRTVAKDAEAEMAEIETQTK